MEISCPAMGEPSHWLPFPAGGANVLERVATEIGVRFVLDTTGHIEPGSMRFLPKTPTVFKRAAEAAIRSWRDRPAEWTAHRSDRSFKQHSRSRTSRQAGSNATQEVSFVAGDDGWVRIEQRPGSFERAAEQDQPERSGGRHHRASYPARSTRQPGASSEPAARWPRRSARHRLRRSSSGRDTGPPATSRRTSMLRAGRHCPWRSPSRQEVRREKGQPGVRDDNREVRGPSPPWPMAPFWSEPIVASLSTTRGRKIVSRNVVHGDQPAAVPLAEQPRVDALGDAASAFKPILTDQHRCIGRQQIDLHIVEVKLAAPLGGAAIIAHIMVERALPAILKSCRLNTNTTPGLANPAI